MNVYLTLNYLHIIGAAVLLGTGEPVSLFS
jgi:uncharacterized membrane protein